MSICACNKCGLETKKNNKYISGHNWVGKKRTIEDKKSKSIAAINRHWKGKTYEEMFGIEKAKYLRELRSKESKGRKYIFTEEHKNKLRKPKSEEYKQKMRGRFVSEEARRNMSISRYKYLNNLNDVNKREYLKRLFKCGKHPNKFEIRCSYYLERMFPNEFEYCGNGTKIINGRNPDFIHKTKNIIIECNGTYWHLTKNGFKDTPENRKNIELLESQKFKNAGYNVIFIWEDCNLNPNDDYFFKTM